MNPKLEGVNILPSARSLFYGLEALLFTCALGFGCHKVFAQAPATAVSPTNSRFARLDILARSADVAQPSSIRNLTHEVLIYPHVFSFPRPIAQVLESKLDQAELDYRAGRGRGVDEAQLVAILNLLGARFNVPGYLRTTSVQMRTLRMKLFIASPAFVGAGLNLQQLNRGDSIPSKMSPLQAFHLLNVMIDQKVKNEDYQDPDLNLAASEEARRQLMLAQASPAERASSRVTLVRKTGTKNTEIRTAIAKSIEAMSLNDGLDLVSSILANLNL